MNASAQSKWETLLGYLSGQAANGLAIALSGGVDSALLALAAREAGIKPLLLVFFSTPLNSAVDGKAARRTAEYLRLPLQILEFDSLNIAQVQANDPQRCYHCKRALFSLLWEWAAAQNIPLIAEGSNVDDMSVHRPGQQACLELKVLQPLAAVGLSKAEIRELARAYGLPVAERPSSPCLASRFPYHTSLDMEALRRVEAGENLLKQAGFSESRLRCHGDMCRLEIPPQQWAALLDKKEALIPALKALGWKYIVMDMEGLQSGSFDK